MITSAAEHLDVRVGSPATRPSVIITGMPSSSPT